MKTLPSKDVETRDPGSGCRSVSRWRRGAGVMSWIIPGATLVLLPKCPVCVAAYVMLFSGVGISLASASRLRTALLVLSVTALLWLVVRWVCRLAGRKCECSERPN